MLRHSFLSWLGSNVAEMDPLSVAGWAYLLLGFFSGLGLLLTSGFSIATGGGIYFDGNTIAWAVAIFALSLSGWALLRSLGRG